MCPDGYNLDGEVFGEYLKALGMFWYQEEENEKDWIVAFKYLEG